MYIRWLSRCTTMSWHTLRFSLIRVTAWIIILYGHFNPLTLILLTAKHPPVPEWVKPSFLIFDIRTLWRSGLSVTLTLRAERQSARISKITNDGLTRSGTGCSRTNMATVGVKGLTMWIAYLNRCRVIITSTHVGLLSKHLFVKFESTGVDAWRLASTSVSASHETQHVSNWRRIPSITVKTLYPKNFHLMLTIFLSL